jgi:hypothetical protein
MPRLRKLLMNFMSNWPFDLDTMISMVSVRLRGLFCHPNFLDTYIVWSTLSYNSLSSYNGIHVLYKTTNDLSD